MASNNDSEHKNDADQIDKKPKDLSYFELSIIEQNYNMLQLTKKSLIANSTINGLLALATLLIVIVTIRQTNLTDYSNQIILDNAKKQVRAYLVVDGIVSKDVATPKINTSVRIKNVGQTPAYDTYAVMTAGLFKNDSTMSIGRSLKTNCDNPDHQGTITIGANEIQGFFAALINEKTNFIPQFDAPLVKQFSEGSYLYIVRGLVCYKDVYKLQHYIKYCYLFRTPDDLTNDSWQPCVVENEQDN